ncbi:MAG: iron-sulfur cluster repair di-iron protein [Acidocella sp. 20-57-95]|nr:MAG: iron-sulfur cluster repair di-iron protein [Acidocella sp. 20-57-95]OYV58118.1 MAG: iron-sulfur cluster repair di-iron protein [Acidocella sp. 21-58-7]HQT64035.1 iron-sulfur cluster repair protein YtfE [Acidocella sp.]
MFNWYREYQLSHNTVYARDDPRVATPLRRERRNAVNASSQQSSENSFATRSLGAIAASLPGSTALFRRYKLDFCCGGNVTLSKAAAVKGLSCAALEAELEAIAAASFVRPQPQATDDLIDLIETRYHTVHRHELPELIRLARRVEAVHKDHAAAPIGLANLLEQILAELESHMQKEELILFPAMRQDAGPMIAGPVSVMIAEHDGHGAYLRELEELTSGFEIPEGACNTWRALYGGGRKFADDLVEHIHTENNILFPRFLI